MAEVMDHQPEKRDDEVRDGSPPLPPPPPPLPSRRDRDSRERRDERNRSPPLPPPPPLAPARSDRDYRRRSSLSPPPYGHQDSRHSPPRRSPPPASKRYRRDDGGYDRRRGSPRGGYGSDDRRYGYDYGRGYDRYGYDDRGGRHGRHSDWVDSGHGPNAGGAQREGLMSYKQFIQELEDDILPDEAQRRYEEYRSEYISTQKHAFFDAHKDEEWLKDKYHPTNLVAVIERRNENARAVAKDFLLELQRGTLNLGPCATVSLNKSELDSVPKSDEDPDVGEERRRNGRGGPTKDNDVSAAPKAHPIASEPRRIPIDIDLAQALVRKLDAEKAILDNILSNNDRSNLEGEKSRGGSMGPIIIVRGPTSVKGLEGADLLDTLITYLFCVHGLDYYGMSEKAEPKGLRHVRSDDKSHDGTSKLGAADWEKKLESFWRERSHGPDPLEKMTAREKIDAAAVDVLDPYVRKIRDEKYGWKYGCGAKGCTKLFHAAEFVHKHLRLKHPEIVMDLTSKVREDLYFQNYMDDADAPGGTPVMQQPLTKDRAPRRRPISDRLRDDRGGRRGNEDRYDRADNSPSHDYDSRNGPEDGNQDETMYESYDGQGLRGTSFPSDIAPPVLMPVPGAGPLGPFVPAPPEVAMRMFRDQSESGGHARKGRPRAAMGSGAPILAAPGFPHDPRRLRSYQDLDAPEDEVTVIDYRSL